MIKPVRMLKPILLSLSIVFILAASFKCSKDEAMDFCLVERTVADSMENRGATVRFSTSYNRWGLYIDTTANFIDDVFIGFPCDVPAELKQEGARAKFSGVLYKLNNSELRNPRIATQHLYFIRIKTLTEE